MAMNAPGIMLPGIQQMGMNAQLAQLQNTKDSRWLTLEVCREYQRSKCSRTELECKFAHPPPHVEVQNGRVTCCFDSIKGKCKRTDPPCKYLHPPQHLREQLLQNGRNNLIMKNLQMQMMQAYSATPGMIPVTFDGKPPTTATYPAQFFQAAPAGQFPGVVPHPYCSVPPSVLSPYATMPASLVATSEGAGLVQPSVAATAVPGGVPSTVVPATHQKLQRADRLEVCREFQRGSCTRPPNECRYAHPPDTVSVDPTDNHVTVCMDHVKGKCSRDSCRYFHPPAHLQAQIKASQQRANAAVSPAMPQMVEVLTAKKRPREPSDDLVTLAGMSGVPGVTQYVKRPAVMDNKSGIPVYQPGTGTTAYQQALAAMQLQQQQQTYIPVAYYSNPHSGNQTLSLFHQVTGHPPSVPRF